MSSVGQRTQRAASLQLSVRGLIVIGTLVQQLVVARLVDPSVYGLIGLVTLTIGLLSVFSETGVAGSIILEESIDEDVLNFAWTLQLLRGLILAAALLFVAPFAASFFRAPELTNLLRFMAIVPVLTGLESPQLLHLRRELSYGKLSLLQVSNLIIGLGLSIPLAVMWRNAWALLIPVVISAGVRMLWSYQLAPHEPRVYWTRAMATRFARFGRFAFINNIIHYAINRGDVFVVGRILDASALGQYTIAFRIGDMPFSELGGVIGDVAFPAFRQAGDNISNAFVRLFGISFLITIPMGIGMAVIAPHLIPLLVGDQWSAAVAPLQIFGVWAVARSFTVVSGPLFNAMGRPEMLSLLAVVAAITLWVFLIPFTRMWGITGTAAALALMNVLMIPLILWLVFRLIRFDIREMSKMIIIPLIGASIMVVTVLLSTELVNPSTDFAYVVVAVVSGVMVYSSWILAASRVLGYRGADPIIGVLQSGQVQKLRNRIHR